MRTGDVAAAVGKGLFAGAVGTAAMTISSTIEAKQRDRESSTAPADAASKVLGVGPREGDEKAEARFSNLVHWSYGSGWGMVRGLIGALGLHGPAAAGAHLAAVWGSELVMLPALEVVPPLKEWGGKELAIDGFHHAVYATATSLVFALLDRRSA